MDLKKYQNSEKLVESLVFLNLLIHKLFIGFEYL